MTIKLESVYFGDIVTDPSQPKVWCAPLAVSALTGHCLHGVEEAFREAKYGYDWPDHFEFPPEDLKATAKVTAAAVRSLGFDIKPAPGCSLFGTSWSEWKKARPQSLFDAPMLVSLATDRPVGHVVAVQGDFMVDTRSYGLRQKITGDEFPSTIVVGTAVLSRENNAGCNTVEVLHLAA